MRRLLTCVFFISSLPLITHADCKSDAYEIAGKHDVSIKHTQSGYVYFDHFSGIDIQNVKSVQANGKTYCRSTGYYIKGDNPGNFTKEKKSCAWNAGDWGNTLSYCVGIGSPACTKTVR